MSDATILQLAVCAALIATVGACAFSAMWRLTIKPWWQRFTWTPRLTPGVLAEVRLVMGTDGQVGVRMEKFQPEANVALIYVQMLERFFAVGSSMGLSVDWSHQIGRVDMTPDGPEYVVALCRPIKAKASRETSAGEMAGEGAGGDGSAHV